MLPLSRDHWKRDEWESEREGEREREGKVDRIAAVVAKKMEEEESGRAEGDGKGIGGDTCV